MLLELSLLDYRDLSQIKTIMIEKMGISDQPFWFFIQKKLKYK